MAIHGAHGRGGLSAETKASIADRLLETMQPGADDLVFDVGSGDGYYSSRFAERCGKVIAVDAYPEVFEGEFYRRANIETQGVDVCSRLGDLGWSSAAHVFFSNSFHDMECQDEILSTLSRELRDGGCLDLIEFHPDTPFGPPRQVRFSKEALKAKVEPYGFREKAFFDLGTHYFVSFERTRRA
ncbi:MAG TPA: methyltransferase domain-containing protein [Rectinemataceae bacterium]|nr:methyltransferase domain-containing protein [Rectinemataceae bacterium]